jgi:hypothetical protein
MRRAGRRAFGRGGWAWLPLGIGVASRLVSIAIVGVVNLFARQPAENPFAVWDGWWYLGIARAGYHADPLRFNARGLGEHDFAFYPVWPALIALASAPTGRPDVLAVVLANLLFLAAAVLTWRVLADRFGGRSATLGLALLAFSPPAFVFSLAYGESLFLALASASFLLRRSLWRGAATAAAMLSRVTGLALVAAACVEVVVARGAERRAALAAVVGGVVAFGGWWLFVAWLTGDPLGYAKATPAFVADGGLGHVGRAFREPTLQQAAWLAFYATMLAGAVLAVRRDRELGIYALAVLALPMLPGGAIQSMPRYAMLAFPAFGALAAALGPRRGLVILGVFAAAQVVFAAWVIPRGVAP